MFLSSNRVVSVCFSSDGKQIASGSWDKTVKIWNASSGELQSTLTGHTDCVTQVEFIDADTVVSSSDDGTTRAWDVATGTYKAEFEGDKFTFTKSSGGNEQTVGAYVVTKKDNLVLVHQTHALTHNEPTSDNNHTVLERRRAAFTGPVVGELLSVGTIAANCVLGNGSCSLPRCMHLQAPWLVGFFI